MIRYFFKQKIYVFTLCATVREVLRNPLLTGVADLQYTVCNATKNELLTRFLKDALKLIKNV